MPTQSNEIECPHCKEVIDISLFAKGELAQKLESEIETLAKIEQVPTLEGKQMIMVVAPR